MSDQPVPARPARWRQPAGDYTPPRPAPRRAGSDHSHLPHSLERPVEHPFSALNSTGRRITVLAELRGQADTTAQLRERLGIERDTAAAQHLNGTIQDLQRSGDIEGTRLPGGPHKLWSVTARGRAVQGDSPPPPPPRSPKGGSAHAPVTQDSGDAEEAEAAGQQRAPDSRPAPDDEAPAAEPPPAATTVPDPPPGDGIPGCDWQPHEHWRETARPDPQRPAAPVAPVTPDRIAVTADGGLLIWLPGEALPLELCPRSTAGIARLCALNAPLLAAHPQHRGVPTHEQ